MTQSNGRLALDIETVSPDIPYWERPDFDDSRDFEVFMITIGYRDDSTGEIESDVLFRQGWGPGPELDVIDAAFERCTSRETEIVLSYNGEVFDFHHLVGRARIAANELGARKDLHAKLTAFLERIESDDLVHDAWAAFGKYTSLEEACERAGIGVRKTRWAEYEHGIDPNEFRVARDQGTPEVLNSDVAQFGEKHLDLYDDGATDTRQFRELEEMLRQYALADVELLFELDPQRPFASSPFS